MQGGKVWDFPIVVIWFEIWWLAQVPWNRRWFWLAFDCCGNGWRRTLWNYRTRARFTEKLDKINSAQFIRKKMWCGEPKSLALGGRSNSLRKFNQRCLEWGDEVPPEFKYDHILGSDIFFNSEGDKFHIFKFQCGSPFFSVADTDNILITILSAFIHNPKAVFWTTYVERRWVLTTLWWDFDCKYNPDIVLSIVDLSVRLLPRHALQTAPCER